jgi:hypothetical protein
MRGNFRRTFGKRSLERKTSSFGNMKPKECTLPAQCTIINFRGVQPKYLPDVWKAKNSSQNSGFPVAIFPKQNYD